MYIEWGKGLSEILFKPKLKVLSQNNFFTNSKCNCKKISMPSKWGEILSKAFHPTCDIPSIEKQEWRLVSKNAAAQFSNLL